MSKFTWTVDDAVLKTQIVSDGQSTDVSCGSCHRIILNKECGDECEEAGYREGDHCVTVTIAEIASAYNDHTCRDSGAWNDAE